MILSPGDKAIAESSDSFFCSNTFDIGPTFVKLGNKFPPLPGLHLRLMRFPFSSFFLV